MRIAVDNTSHKAAEREQRNRVWLEAQQNAFDSTVLGALKLSLPTNAKPENHSPATGESPALSPDRHYKK